MVLLGALAAAFAAVFAPTTDAAPLTARSYVSGFCGSLTLNESDPVVLRRVLKSWNARTSTAEEGEAFRPQGVDAPGQLVIFAEAAEPHAFVERRQGICSLVYSGDRVPASVIADLKTPLIPTGAGQILARGCTLKTNGLVLPVRSAISSNSAMWGITAYAPRSLKTYA